MPEEFIIISGNPVEGFKFYGTWPTMEDAAETAATEFSGSGAEWWVAPIEPIFEE